MRTRLPGSYARMRAVPANMVTAGNEVQGEDGDDGVSQPSPI